MQFTIVTSKSPNLDIPYEISPTSSKYPASPLHFACLRYTGFASIFEAATVLTEASECNSTQKEYGK